MCLNEKPSTPANKTPLRLFVLITTKKQADIATKVFHECGVPSHNRLHASGTAPNEIMDMLGLGNTDKILLFTMMPKTFADMMLRKMHNALLLGTPNSGIAFTMPVNGANNLAVKMFSDLTTDSNERNYAPMSDITYSIIAAVVNIGYSEDVMDAARSAGAAGGTVVHTRHINNEAVAQFWGFNIQDERDIVFIVSSADDRIKIMQAISEKCGINSKARGMVFSLPLDGVSGINEYK